MVAIDKNGLISIKRGTNGAFAEHGKRIPQQIPSRDYRFIIIG
jgi:hypothetical protein